ncbi:MAG: hypothetical protein ACYC2U_01245 [Candidatus Amoebophilus sp.]
MPKTQIYTLYLNTNNIGDDCTEELDQILPTTKIHTLDIEDNSLISGQLLELLTEKFSSTNGNPCNKVLIDEPEDLIEESQVGIIITNLLTFCSLLQ